MIIRQNQGLFTQNRYNYTQSQLNNTLNKLSSGYKINQAADDAAGLGISEKMRGQIRGLHRAGENIQNGLLLLQTADGGLGTITDPNLLRMRELAIQAANDTLTNDDRFKIQMEIDAIKEGIDDIVDGTEFNTIKVLRPPAELPTATPNGVVDIVLVFDNTGSMSSKQQNFAANIQNLISSIQGKGVSDIRIGILSYYDSNYEKSDFAGDKWTSDISEVIAEINRISATNDGGTENNMTAIEEVVNFYDFREYPNSNTNYKHLIIITDELGDDDYKTQDIAQLLKDQHIMLHGVMDSAPGLDHVIRETGGQKVQLNGNPNWGADLSKNIGEAIGSSANTPQEEGDMHPLILQVGANAGQHIKLNLYDCRTTTIGIDKVSVITREDAEQALTIIDKALQQISSYRSEYGAFYNRLEYAYNNVQNAEENLIHAESLLRDTDMAQEMSKLKKDQLLLQSSQAMMAQINQMSQGILTLLK